MICDLFFSPFLGDTWVEKISKTIDAHIKMDMQYSNDEDKIPAYKEEEATRRLMEAYADILPEQAAKTLMIRGTKKTPRGVIFTRDPRLKLRHIEPSPSEQQMLTLMKRLHCDLLIVRVKKTPYIVPDEIREQYYDLYRQNCQIFKDITLDGSHHIHMTEPAIVARHINDFLDSSLAHK